MAGMMLACDCYVTTTKHIHQWYQICLDNGSQVNIEDPRLLTNLCTEIHTYCSMNGAAVTESIDHIVRFF
jgi:hypothetical protein